MAKQTGRGVDGPQTETVPERHRVLATVIRSRQPASAAMAFKRSTLAALGKPTADICLDETFNRNVCIVLADF